MTEQTIPSRRAGLRDEIAAALEAADYRMDMRRGDLADSVLPVLYRAWPWLRAEAEDAVPAGQAPATDGAAEAEPSDPTQCSGEEGFCPEHGFHRHSLKQPGEPEAATDQTALRDRIAEALADADGWKWAPGFKDQSPTWQGYQARADAVLAALPASVDRAAVLREEAARIRAHCPDHLDADSAEGSWMDCHCAVADDIERRAAEARAAGDYARALATPPTGGAAAYMRERLAAASAVVVRRATDETPGEARCGCPHPDDEHSVYGCADGCACEWMPRRKPTVGAPQPKEARP